MALDRANTGSLCTHRPHPTSLPDFGFFSPGEDDTMRAWDNASDLRNAALGKEISLRNFAEWERKVRTDFWSKLKRFAGQVPFVEDIVAGYYCALDPATPMRVRGCLRPSPISSCRSISFPTSSRGSALPMTQL
jgi:hypothetical protein